MPGWTVTTPAEFWHVWLAGCACVVATACVSIVYRIAHEKPVLFFSVPKADFIERTASGSSKSKFGGASRCLVVAIANGRLVIRPFFPFNLLFIPEMYGLECDVPIENVLSARMRKRWLGQTLEIELRDKNGERRAFSLYLAHPDKFLQLLPEQARSTAQVPG